VTTLQRSRLSRASAFALVIFLAALSASAFSKKPQKTINKNLTEQVREKDGKSAWQSHKQAEYQTKEGVLRGRGHLKREKAREKAFQDLTAAGPIPLEQVLYACLEYNDRVSAARAGMAAAQGERLINLSRFLPHISFDLRHQAVDTAGASKAEANSQSLVLSQKLLEFGAESDSSIAARAYMRNSLFGFESEVSAVLSGARKKFYTVLLRQQQIEERGVLLKEYRERHEKMAELEKVRRVLEVDVLTSRLNVLHEEARINALNRDLLRQKMDLMKLAGFPVHQTEFKLQGAITPFTLPLDTCVDIAFRRSTGIARARAELYEQERVARRTWWTHAPDLDLMLKWQEDENAAGVAVSREQDTYGVSGFAERFLKGPAADLWGYGEIMTPENRGWYVDLKASIPLFQGFYAFGRQKKEKARLRQAFYDLRAAMDSVELKVRKFYQEMLEVQKEVEILKETSSISRERLRIQEKLKELGKISDNELETFRTRFFQDQGMYYNKETELIHVQENLRHEMRWFEPGR
jgi:outer membrane protein TolC